MLSGGGGRPDEAIDAVEARVVRIPIELGGIPLELLAVPSARVFTALASVTRADLDTLQDEELLNDTIMDFYIKHIESNLDQETKQQCHFFSTFFWKRLNQEKDARARHAGVAKWTRKVDIFSKRFLFVPICDSLHLSLIHI